MRFISLLTDFGHQDASIAIMKSKLLLHNPDAQLLDLSHNASSNALQDAAYVLQSAYRQFPQGTCHIILVGIYYTVQASLILGEKDGHYFLAPNNGILPMALGTDNIELWQCYAWEDASSNFNQWQDKCAQIAHQLEQQKPRDLGFPSFKLDRLLQMRFPRPILSDNTIDCKVLFITHHGNIVLNITQEEFEQYRAGRSFRIDLKGNGYINQIHQNIAKAKSNNAFCRFNKNGYLEIGQHNENAAKMLGFFPYSGQQIFYSNVKIIFE